jgi:dipeptidyl aminopeptidase/acylaminoacyl peptidase
MKDYVAQSPITYVPMSPQIKTPTLLLGNTGDSTIPITESYQLYHALEGQRSHGEVRSLPGRWTSSRRPRP